MDTKYVNIQSSDNLTKIITKPISLTIIVTITIPIAKNYNNLTYVFKKEETFHNINSIYSYIIYSECVLSPQLAAPDILKET